jgi:hypothetical protein
LRSPEEAESAKTSTPVQTNFKTPNQVAALDDAKTQYAGASAVNASTRPVSKENWRDKLRHFHFGKREWITSTVVVLVCGSIVAFVLTKVGDKPVASAKPVVNKIVKPAPAIVSNLTGLPIDPAIKDRTVTGIMIENSPSARPQAGLSQAGVVFEAIAEGGITRFLALFQDQAPENVGPVRSARPYYVQWALGFDAGYAHVGGSPEALARIREWGVRDLDQFHNSGAYRRIRERSAPHNVYTSLSAMHQLETSKGFTTSSFTGFARKKAKPSPQPNAKSIDLKISGPLYNAHYDYVPGTNSYNRSQAGAGHVDSNTNAPLSPNVVVAMVLPYGIAPDGHSQYGVIGSGQVFIFQDGTVTSGTWTKASEKEQIKFTDAAGKPILLNPGQTWLTAVANPGQVISAP